MSGPLSCCVPPLECNTTVVGMFTDGATIQLHWKPVTTSGLECPPSVEYCVTYRCCSTPSQSQRNCTTYVALNFMEKCETDDQVVFSMQTNRSSYVSSVIVNHHSHTGNEV